MATTKCKSTVNPAARTRAIAPKASSRKATNNHPRAIALAVATAFLPWYLSQTAYAQAPAPDTLPTGGQITNGSGQIHAPQGTHLQIDQYTQKMIAEFGSFSIGANASVNLSQPGASSIALFRDVGGDASKIFGNLTANGQLFISNQNGVLFGASARVDVGALFATSLSITDHDFMAGRYHWYNEGNAGSVVNQGQIITANGYTALVGPQVRNDGIIIARAGSVALAVGDRVSLDMIGDGLISVSVDQSAYNASVINTGSITADGGTVLLTARSANALLDTVINNIGLIRANSLVERNGEIVLDGGNAGVVSVTGTLQAAGVDAGTTGGTVKVLGQYVGLFDNAAINASGDAGGGTVLIGGNFQGKGLEQNALRTYVGSGAVINADAVTTGNGGQVIVWADDATQYSGSINARGGAQAGDGGFVEVSGKQTLGFAGLVDTTAAYGAVGTLLLDPTDITISTAASTVSMLFNAVTTTYADTVTSPSNLNRDILQTQLGLSNVIVDTSSALAGTGNITVQDSVSWNSAFSLTLNAVAGITVNATDTLAAALSITNAGTGGIVFTAGSAVTVNGSVSTGGSVSVTAPTGFAQGIASTITTGTGLTVNVGAASTASGVISGTGGLTKAGTGTLTLSGVNLYTGATTISAGSLVLDATGTITDSSGVANSGNLTIQANKTIDSMTGTGSTTLGANTLTIGDVSNVSAIYGGVISGTGGLTKAGTGTLTLSGVNLYTGATTISAGSLVLDATGTIADSSGVANSGNLTIQANKTIDSMTGAGSTTLGASTLTIGDATNISATYGGVISGTGGLTKAGTGTLTLTGTSDYSGATTISAGALTVSGATAAAGTGTVVVGANTLNINDGATVANAITINGGTIGNTSGAGAQQTGGVTLGGNSNLSSSGTGTGLTVSGIISGLGFGIPTTGPVTLGGVNTYTGATTINAGSTLTLNATGTITDSSGVANAGNLTIQANKTIDSMTGTGSTTLGANTLTIGDASNTSAIYGGVISGVGGGLTKAGTGTLTLLGVNLYTGATTISAGTLQLGAAGVIPDGSALVDNATLDMNGFSETVGSLAGTGTVTSGVVGAVTLTAGGDNTSTTFSGVMQNGAGTLSFTKAGTGTLTLSGTNTYTGTTTINSGNLTAQGGSAIVDTGVVDLLAGTFEIDTAETIGRLSGALGTTVTLDATLTFGDATDTTIASTIGSTGGLTNQGTSTVTLSGTNTYTGTTTVNAGVLRLANNAALGGAGALQGTTVATGAAVEINGAGLTIAEPLTLNGDGAVVGGGALRNLANNNTWSGAIMLGSASRINSDAGILTLSGGVDNGGFLLTSGGAGNTTTATTGISGTGGLTKDGAGTLTFGVANTYTGATTIMAGTLAIGASNVLSDGSTIVVDNGTTFDIGAFSDTVGGLQLINGSVTGAGGTLTSTTDFDVRNGSVTAILGGAVGLTKTTVDTVTLSGANTYTGTTAVNAGTLTLDGGAAIADGGAVTLANVAGATLNLGASETIGSLAGGGALGGNVTLGANTLTAGGNNTSTTFSGMASGTGGLTKAGTGTLTLSGVNLYTGATTISAGSLVLDATGTIADSSGVANSGNLTIQANKTIDSMTGTGSTTLGANTLTIGDASNTSAIYGGVISGVGGLTKAGTGTLTLSAASNYDGVTSINAGTLQASNGSALGSTAGGTTIANGATLAINGVAIGAEAVSVIGTGVGGNALAWTGPAALGGNVTLTGNATVGGTGSMTFSGTINGGNTLNVNSAGNTTFAGAVGNLTPLASLATDAGGATTISGGAVRTSGSQNYGDAVLLGAGATLTATTTGSVSFASTLNGAQALTVSAPTSAAFNGNVGGTTALSSLSVTSPVITLSNVTTNGAQQYNGNVTFNSTHLTNGGNFGVTGTTTVNTDSSITSGVGNVTLSGAVNGPGSLTINSGGTTSFGSTVGGTTALASITTDPLGSTSLAGNVTTSGSMSFQDSTSTTVTGLTMTSTGNSSILLNNANASSPGFISTTGDVTLGGTLMGSSGTPMAFSVTPNSLTMTQLVTAFYSGPAIPGTIIFPAGSSITFNGALIAASIIQQQAASASSSVSATVAAVIVDEANKTFGTDSVAEAVEYGFAGEVGTTPPMDHRIDESGISVPRCVQESREGMPCK